MRDIFWVTLLVFFLILPACGPRGTSVDDKIEVTIKKPESVTQKDRKIAELERKVNDLSEILAEIQQERNQGQTGRGGKK